ncbi:M23 family metallopeptidase [Mobiluncus holmesii]|uniref:M23 family metallopeptidase n=1 Tax=Mobiluncus porci TaxID=2652278 RepID=A0A7K0K4C8_9ACTO|nr:M23 family metallopeptidase [Mobiluncus porci]
MESERPRSRKELRELERRRNRRHNRLNLSPKRNLASDLPRIGLLGFLASVTVVAPLSGLVSPDLSIAAPSGDFETNETLLSIIASADEVSVYDSDLNAVPASARTRLMEAKQLGNCVSKENSANGDVRAAAKDQSIVWPMYAGSYNFTSPWGMRIHPITGQRTMHEGVDWSAPVGTAIYAVADGEVTFAGMEGSTGTITIKHEIDGQVFYSRYLHMYANGIYVSKGDKVKAGDLIAGVGSTGRSTGAHLHFEIRLTEDKTVDPMTFMKKQGAVYINDVCE